MGTQIGRRFLFVDAAGGIMEIKASSVYDLKATKAAWRAGVYKKKDPGKSFWRYILLAAIIVTASVLYQFLVKQVLLMWVLSGLLVFFSVMLSLLYFLAPVRMYKNAGTMADMRKNFIFREKELYVESSGEMYQGESTVQYSLLFKAMETGAYFFIYLTKSQIYIVDKSTLEGGTAEDIRSAMSAVLGEKYMVCDY